MHAGIKLQRSLTSMSHMPFDPSLFIYGFSVVCLILTYIFESIISASGPRLFVGNFSFKIQAKSVLFLIVWIYLEDLGVQSTVVDVGNSLSYSL